MSDDATTPRSESVDELPERLVITCHGRDLSAVCPVADDRARLRGSEPVVCRARGAKGGMLAAVLRRHGGRRRGRRDVGSRLHGGQRGAHVLLPNRALCGARVGPGGGARHGVGSLQQRAVACAVPDGARGRCGAPAAESVHRGVARHGRAAAHRGGCAARRAAGAVLVQLRHAVRRPPRQSAPHRRGAASRDTRAAAEDAGRTRQCQRRQWRGRGLLRPAVRAARQRAFGPNEDSRGKGLRACGRCGERVGIGRKRRRQRGHRHIAARVARGRGHLAAVCQVPASLVQLRIRQQLRQPFARAAAFCPPGHDGVQHVPPVLRRRDVLLRRLRAAAARRVGAGRGAGPGW